MAAISVTYTFSNSTVADADQVNQNFTDVINGTSDGTKDLTVNDISGNDITATSNFIAAAGTAALPSVTTNGDPNTGMWFSTADTINFSTAGTERLEIDGTSIDATVPILGTTITMSGTATFNGAVNLGDGAADIITNNGSLAGDWIPNVDSSIDLGSTSFRFAEAWVDTVTGTTVTMTNLGGTLTTAAQPNVTSLGTLTGLTVSGDVQFNQSGNNQIESKSDGITINESSTSTCDFRVETDNEATAFWTDASADEIHLRGNVILNESGVATYDFRVEGDTNANLLFCDASADNVGVGTSSPSTILHIQDTTAPVVQVESTDPNSLARFNMKNDVQEWGIDVDGASDDNFRIRNNTSGTVALSIDTSQNVGIGTASPDTLLTIDAGSNSASATLALARMYAGLGQANAAYLEIKATSNSTASNRRVELDALQDGGSPSAQLFVQADGGDTYFGGDVGIGRAPTYKCDIYAASGNVAANVDSNSIAIGQAAQFQAEATGNSATRNANFGIYYRDSSSFGGTDAPCGYFSLDQPDDGYNTFWVDNDNLLCTYPNAFTRIGNDALQDGAVAVGDQSSDERFKRNIREIPYGLKEVLKLSPIQYEKQRSDTTMLGFGAQTTLPILPETVTDTKLKVDDSGIGRLYMQYVQIIPVLTKAIQELSAKVTALEAK